MKKVMAMLLAVVMVFALAACGSSASAPAAATEAPAAEAPAAAEQTTAVEVEQADADAPGDAGFEEIPIFEDEEAGFINVNAVYFQPVPMVGDQTIGTEGFNMHIEADVSAMENDLGYGVGDWIPYLTIDYKITASDGTVAAEGTFMHMAASDGPHYGANILLDKADTYSIDFAIHSPAEEGYLIHSDAETGPGGLLDDVWGDGPLTVHFDGWDYVPQEW